jgi:hypothetical protein
MDNYVRVAIGMPNIVNLGQKDLGFAPSHQEP